MEMYIVLDLNSRMIGHCMAENIADATSKFEHKVNAISEIITEQEYLDMIAEPNVPDLCYE